MTEERSADGDDGREAEVLPERELMGLVAPDAAPGDLPPSEPESEDDEGD